MITIRPVHLPVGNMNIYTKFHGNPSNSCSDILVALEEKPL